MNKRKISKKDLIKVSILTALIVGLLCVLVLGSMFAPARSAKAENNGNAVASAQNMTENNLPDWVSSVLPPFDLEYSPDRFYVYAETSGTETGFIVSFSDVFLREKDIFIKPYDKDGVFLMPQKSTAGRINGEGFMLDVSLDFTAGGYLVIFFVDTSVSNAYTVIEISEELSNKEHLPPNSFYDLYKEGAQNADGSSSGGVLEKPDYTQRVTQSLPGWATGFSKTDNVIFDSSYFSLHHENYGWGYTVKIEKETDDFSFKTKNGQVPFYHMLYTTDMQSPLEAWFSVDNVLQAYMLDDIFAWRYVVVISSEIEFNGVCPNGHANCTDCRVGTVFQFRYIDVLHELLYEDIYADAWENVNNDLFNQGKTEGYDNGFEDGKNSVKQDYTAEDINNAYAKGKADALAELGDKDNDNGTFWDNLVNEIGLYGIILAGVVLLIAIVIIVKVLRRLFR